MSKEIGYQVRFVLDGGGSFVVRAAPPDHITVTAIEREPTSPGGERVVVQDSFYDPAASYALATGEGVEEAASGYLDMYSAVVGDAVDTLIIPPGRRHHFQLEGDGEWNSVWLTVQAAPPDGVAVLAHATPPGRKPSPVPLLHDRFTDPEGFASLVSGIGAEDVAARYVRRYEARFGRVIPPGEHPGPGIKGSEGMAPLPTAVLRWGWALLAAVGLVLLGGLLLTRWHGTERRSPGAGITTASSAERYGGPVHHRHGRRHD